MVVFPKTRCTSTRAMVLEGSRQAAVGSCFLLYVETLTAFFACVLLLAPLPPPPLPLSPRQVIIAAQKAVEGGAGGRSALGRFLSCGPFRYESGGGDG